MGGLVEILFQPVEQLGNIEGADLGFDESGIKFGDIQQPIQQAGEGCASNDLYARSGRSAVGLGSEFQRLQKQGGGGNRLSQVVACGGRKRVLACSYLPVFAAIEQLLLGTDTCG